MFNLKKSKKPQTTSDVYEQNHQLLAMARAAGDKKTEIILSMVSIANDAMKMREAQNRIMDLFEENLDELLEDACLYFPIDLSAKLSDLQQYFDCIDSQIDDAASLTAELVKQMALHVKS